MVSTDVTQERLSALPILSRIAIYSFRLLGKVPFRLRGAVGFFLGYLFGLLPTREREVAHKQISTFLSPVLANKLVPKVFGNLSRTIFESLNLSIINKDPAKVVVCDDWIDAEKWLADSRPLVVLTAHTGNWELLAAYAIARGAQVTTIGREARIDALQAALKDLRARYGVETVWRSDRAGVKRILSCLKEKRVLAALIDQDTKVDSRSVPFFDTPAHTPSALIELGLKYDSRFVYAFIARTSAVKFKMITKEILLEKEEADPTFAILAQYNSALEDFIRMYPDQWVWSHKRWRTGADGKTKSSREYIEWLTQKSEIQASL